MKIKDYYYSNKYFKLLEIKKGILQTQNIPNKLEKYYNNNNYISYTNKKKKLLNYLYSIAQIYNLQFKLSLIKKYSNKQDIIDFGCGNGEFLKYMKKNNYKIQGYEPNKIGQYISKKKLSIEIIKNNIEKLKKSNIITLWHVLEHLENPLSILKNLEKKLNKHGIIIIASPNYKSFDAKYYKKFWAGYDVPRHIYHYSKEGFINYYSKYFKIIGIEHLILDSYYISLLSENYKKSIFKLLKAIYIGFKSNWEAKKTGNYSSLIYILKSLH